MSRAAQASFLKHPAFRHLDRREHGGKLYQGMRKRERILDPGKPLHVVLRSKRATGDWSLLDPAHERRIGHLVRQCARRQGVRIFRYANAGNHLHLVIQARRRKNYQDFLRLVGGLVARAVTGARKGRRIGKFWDALAYSRVVTWGRELRNVSFYVLMNELEGLGIWWRRWSQRARLHASRAGPRPPA
jgi:REP element-mobilizing transposase RayT